jgi:hypothetical protein
MWHSVRVQPGSVVPMPSAVLRRWHSYIGLFIAPSVLFFALTGAAQIFNLHEAHDGYHPAVWVEKLSAVHKDQVFREPEEHGPAEDHPAGPTSAPAPSPPEEEERMSAPTLALKCFFLVVALGLTASTCIGVWMGLTQLRSARVALILLGAGAVIPLALLMV